MPKKLHDKLKRQAAKKGYTGDRADRYVYGTLHNIEEVAGEVQKRWRKKK